MKDEEVERRFMYYPPGTYVSPDDGVVPVNWLEVPKTIVPPGITGDVEITTQAGRVNFAPWMETLTVTNVNVTPSTVIDATVANHDPDVASVQVESFDGYFVLRPMPNLPTVEMKVNFLISAY